MKYILKASIIFESDLSLLQLKEAFKEDNGFDKLEQSEQISEAYISYDEEALSEWEDIDEFEEEDDEE